MRARSSIVLGCVASFALALGVLAAARQQPAGEGASAAPPTVEILKTPAGPGSSEPQITVTNDRLILSWLEVMGERATLKFAERTKTGWSDPLTVYSGEHFFVNAFDVPSVRVMADGTIAAHWLETNGPNPDASQIKLSLSKDGGKTWTRPVNPHHDATQTEHGFVSLFQPPNAAVGLVWIDGRATDPEKETGDMSLRATEYDATGRQLGETVVNPRVCECCSTAAAVTAEGVAVVYRGRSQDEIRDIFVSRLVGGHWAMPTDVHKDNWQLDACPINGPAVSAIGNNLLVGWFMAKNDKGQAFIAFSGNGGRAFGRPIRVDDVGSLGRLGVAMLEDGSAAVTWMETARPTTQLRVRIVKQNGDKSAPLAIANTSGERYARVAHVGNELVFSWADGEGKTARVQTARLLVNAGK